MTNERLRGRRVLVTGAAGGQGVAVARRLAAEGARLVLTDRDRAGLEVAAATVAATAAIAPLALAADVRDEEQVAAVVEAAVRELGGLDGLYNNAGVYRADRDAPVDRLPLAEWNDVLAINTTGVFLFCKHAIPALLRSDRGGVVVNVSSTAGRAGDPDCHAYAASKGALHALTRSIAQRWGAEGLRALVLCPGFVETEMVRFALDDADLAARIEARTALRRFARPEEVAALAAFALSDDGSFLTSCEVPIDGGLVK